MLVSPPSFDPFPPPPSAPRRRKTYAHPTTSMYGLSNPSTRTLSPAVIPLRAFRRQTIYEPSPTALPLERPNGSWLMKLVPGIFRRPKPAQRLSRQLADMPLTGGEEDGHVPLVRRPTKLKSKGRFKVGAGVENRIPPGWRAQRVRHSQSFSGYARTSEEEEDLDENMAEVREALQVNAAIHARGYRYERLDPAQRRHLQKFVDREPEERL
ncbi:hypothetical protein DFH06DRAFT_1226954 [Mycena polygramma]|nr:hypothetical protein DFH06DRAFT_1226954 [Mycena polygramma]